MRRQVDSPVLQVLGECDPAVRLGAKDGSRGQVNGQYAAVVLRGVGHYAPEEDPKSFNAVLLDWLTHLG
jgi:pimeloyl-ACP methyl ester carboxylesterase